MKKYYCVGVCPFCSNQGLIIPIRVGGAISYICDESFHRFDTFEDIAKKNFVFDGELRDDFMELEEFLAEMPEMESKVFIFEDNMWRNIKGEPVKIFKSKQGE